MGVNTQIEQACGSTIVFPFSGGKDQGATRLPNSLVLSFIESIRDCVEVHDVASQTRVLIHPYNYVLLTVLDIVSVAHFIPVVRHVIDLFVSM